MLVNYPFLKDLFYRILWLLFALLLLGLLGYRLWIFYQPLGENQSAADPQAKVLFDQLQQQSLLKVSAAGVITLPARDTVLALQAQQQLSDKAQLKALESTLDMLYHKPPGTRVQQQIALWNQTRQLAAVRDNVRGNDPGLNWQAYTPSGQPLHVSASGYVPLSFGYINQGKLPQHFGDWLSVGESRPVVFKKTFVLPKAQRIRLDVIGSPDSAGLNGYHPQLKRLEDKLQKACTGASAAVYVLHLTIPAGRHTLSLPVTPTVNPVSDADGLAIYYPAAPAGNQDKCSVFARAKTLAWESSRLYRNKQKPLQRVSDAAKIGLSTADNVALLTYNPGLSATDKAQELGLIPLVGQDSHDVFSFSGMSRNLSEDSHFRLSINAALQEKAIRILEKAYRRSGNRAALVLLKPDNGEIVVAAGIPRAPGAVSLWDRQAFKTVYPRRDPYLFLPWQGLGGFNAPGSTFKVITSVALLRAAHDNALIKQAVYGMSLNTLRRKLNIPATGTWHSRYERDMPSVSNYANESLRAIHYLSQCAEVKKPAGFSLLDALGHSFNTWFAGVSEAADRDAVTGQRPSYLAQAAHDFGYGQIFSLQPPDVPLQRIIPQTNTDGHYNAQGDVLNAFGGQMDYDLEIKDAPPALVRKQRANQLVRLSFGQASATTPLTMALAAASIATGKWVRPRLFTARNDEAFSYPGFADIDGLSRQDLAFLRLAMQGVIQGGTATGVLDKPRNPGDIACRAYAKTGTADVAENRNGKQLGKSAWMMGYLVDSKRQPTIAFACMVQNATGTGGRACGPLLKPLLTAYEKQQEK